MVEPSAAEFARIRRPGLRFLPDPLPPRPAGIADRAPGPRRLWPGPALARPCCLPSVLFQPAWIPPREVLPDRRLQPGAFRRHGPHRPTGRARVPAFRSGHPGREWILAGGLNPGNIGEALKRTERAVGGRQQRRRVVTGGQGPRQGFSGLAVCPRGSPCGLHTRASGP